MNWEPRDTTVAGLIRHLTDLVETNPEWAAFKVLLEDENGRRSGWNGKTFARVEDRDLELEIFG